MVVGGLKGFSLICSDEGVEPKLSDGIFEVLNSSMKETK